MDDENNIISRPPVKKTKTASALDQHVESTSKLFHSLKLTDCNDGVVILLEINNNNDEKEDEDTLAVIFMDVSQAQQGVDGRWEGKGKLNARKQNKERRKIRKKIVKAKKQNMNKLTSLFSVM